MVAQLKEASIELDGLFFNADVGFYTKAFRNIIDKEGLILNFAPHEKNV